MIKLTQDNGKTYGELSELSRWEKNPKFLMKEDKDRLLNQILDLGQYKPLLVLGDAVNVKGDEIPAGTVIGGNSRYLVYSERKEEFSRVWVSVLTFEFIQNESLWYPVVNGETQSRRKFIDPMQIMIEYSQSDNDQAGKTDIQALAELVNPYQDMIPMENYKIQVYEQKPLVKLMDGLQKDDEARKQSDAEEQEEAVSYLTIKFTPEQFKKIEPVINEIKSAEGLENNTDLFLHLVKSWNDLRKLEIGTEDVSAEIPPSQNV